MTPISERGYLILAVNTAAVDYVACARVLAMSIKYWHPTAEVCLLTDQQVVEPIFDYVHLLPHGDLAPNSEWKLVNDWQSFYASPFRQTIKLEADMVLTGPIDHWWTQLEKRDVVLTLGCRDFYNQPAKSRAYRKVFDLNDLPDVYNAITYWRFSREAFDFANLIRDIFTRWNEYQVCLRGAADVDANTDLVYALAARMFGDEKVTLPWATYPSLTHMKAEHCYCVSEPWTEQLTWEFDQGQIRINTIAQEYPLHYHVKEFAQTLETLYGQLLASRS